MGGLTRAAVATGAAMVLLGSAAGGAAQANVTPAASAPVPGWSITPSPNPRAENGLLQAVSCSAISVCTAVGLHVEDSGIGVTLAERRSGGEWAVQSTPNPTGAEASALKGVSCPSGTLCTAVGQSVVGSGAQRTLAEHWDGGDWRIQPTPNPAGSKSSTLSAVACPSADTCTAVGTSNSKLLVERWGGARWRIQPAPVPPGAQFSELNGVSCEAASCIAVGDYVNSSGLDVTLAERWDRSAWRLVPAPTPSNQLNSFFTWVACPASSSCIAVGTSVDGSGNPAGTFAERWNGTRWTLQSTPTQRTAGGFLGSVWCLSATACIATGSTDAGTLAERLSGTTWSVLPTPDPPGTQGDFMNSVSCSSLSACIGVGGTSGFPPQTLAERWNGANWRIQPTPVLPGVQLLSNFSVACSAESTCVAAGGFENDGPGSVSLAERWRGSRMSAAQTAPAALSPRPYGGIAGCIRAAVGEGLDIGAAATRIGPNVAVTGPRRSQPVAEFAQIISLCAA
jgi:hypothetical protein